MKNQKKLIDFFAQFLGNRHSSLLFWLSLMIVGSSLFILQPNKETKLKNKVASINIATLAATNWRSSLYPENWYPGYKDSQGRFLHDFSYAGYHMGETEPPANPPGPVIDTTQAPYNADKTGIKDSTTAIQNAINYVGQNGGGVVYLPAGTYQVKPANSTDTSLFSLQIKDSKVVLRGDGPSKTFIFNNDPYMRFKSVVLVSPIDNLTSVRDLFSWNGSYLNVTKEVNPVKITRDLPEQTKVIPVETIDNYDVGDWIAVRSDCTKAFVADLKMTGIWDKTPEDLAILGGIVIYRQITAIDPVNKTVTIDIPTRFWYKTRDNSRIYKMIAHLSEVGIENLAIGMVQNNKSGREESDYTVNNTGAYQMHLAFAITINHTVNGWVKNVSSYRPVKNTSNFHLLSNGVRLYMSRGITIDSVNMSRPEYEGGGGNGYMYRIESNDCLIKNSFGYHGRHNYSIMSMGTSGNVFYRSTASSGRLENDFHMHLSQANLLDNMSSSTDVFEAEYHGSSGTLLHGQTTTQSVFWNTNAHEVKSGQFGWGYIIGTQGPNCSNVKILGSDTDRIAPKDFKEGACTGSSLTPQSLYLDQLQKRLAGWPSPPALATPSPSPTPTPSSTVCSNLVERCSSVVDGQWVSYIPTNPPTCNTVNSSDCPAGCSHGSATCVCRLPKNCCTISLGEQGLDCSLVSPTPLPSPSASPVSGLFFEAEAGSITPPFKISSSGYIYQTVQTTDPSTSGKASYQFNLETSGNYLVKAKVSAPTTGSNSLFVNIDSEPTSPTMVWDIKITTGFQDRAVSWRGTGTVDANQYNPKVFSLSAGSHTLIIRGREANVKLDKIWLEPSP